MRWHIEQFIFCERQQTLISGEKSRQLEPMVVELLAYFCRNTNQIISRDQLIEQVWSGRIITDNAVSKLITKLRKIFDDDAKKPQFIATFPKKGYKFIAVVSAVKEENKNARSVSADEVESITLIKIKWLIPVMGIISLVVVSFVLTSVLIGNSPLGPVLQVKALTRDAGRESQPQISPDGKYLTYIEVREKKIHLWIKSLVDQQQIEVSHGEEEQAWVGPGSWNSDGSQLAYLVTTAKSCRYFIREFNNISLGEPRLIHNCPAGSAGKIVFTHDDNRLVYTEAESRHTPYSLFEINLQTGKKRRLAQPELYLGGNSQFDLHPKTDTLLISSPDKQQWEGFYSLDLKTDQLKLLFKQDAYICCGIWSHSGDRVVLMGEHPAYQLVSYDLKGGDKRTIYSGSQLVRSPKRHINGIDYLFASGAANQNALYYDFQTNVSRLVANTSVDDRLATFAHHNNQIAWIGLSSGSEEVWLTGMDDKTAQKVTNFNDSRHYVQLLWSYNGDNLLALTLNEIHLIDRKTGKAKVLEIPQVEIRAVSWKSDQIISYSIKVKNRWRVNYYDLSTRQVTAEKQDWQFVRFTENTDDILWLNDTGELFFSNNYKKVTDKELIDVDLIDGRLFNLKKLGDKWVWQKREKGKYQLMVKQGLNIPAKRSLISDSFHFDLSEKGLLYHTVNTIDVDIYQTLSH